MLEAEENFEKDLIQVGREMQAPARNWLRQRHGIQAGLMRFVLFLPNDNNHLAIGLMSVFKA